MAVWPTDSRKARSPYLLQHADNSVEWWPLRRPKALVVARRRRALAG
jgi:uncharacterized protein YyaL (SSP411 family)